jgi:protein-disulfide isomerase
MNNKTKNEPGSGLPVLIILGVLLIAVIGGWWFYTTSKTNPAASNTAATNANKPPANQKPQSTPMITSVPGAQPPHFKGGQNAPVVIEEFADFQCPTCATVHTMMNEINASYGTRVKFIYRHFPLTQIHPNAFSAALASEAAGMQGKFWEMQNLLFQNQQRWSAASGAQALFESYAQTLGLDIEKFKADMAGTAVNQRVQADMQRGRSLGVNSTPTILINSRPVTVEQMSIPGMKQIIGGELANTQGGAQQTQTTAVPPAKPAENKPADAAGNANAQNK